MLLFLCLCFIKIISENLCNQRAKNFPQMLQLNADFNYLSSTTLTAKPPPGAENNSNSDLLVTFFFEIT